MDPITTAIIAAIGAGAASSAKEVAAQAITDAYGKLKELLGKKFGARSKVVKAVKELEANPKSEGRQGVLNEEVVAAKADQDQELLQIAQALLKNIKSRPGGTQMIQTALGNQNIQIAGDSNTVNLGTPKNKNRKA
jgi:hypothetical protein